jgi:pantoate kinase
MAKVIRATAYSPGHASLIFGKVEEDNILLSGSFGAGIALSPGAIADVTVEPRNEVFDANVTVWDVDGKRAESAETTLEAVNLFARKNAFKGILDVNIKLHFPLSQGFGMSAAGTLAALYAFAHSIQAPVMPAVECAHEAEIRCGTGLGDIAGIMAGGFSLRESAGIPPHSKARMLDIEGPVVACVVGPQIKTRDVITGERMKKITAVAREVMSLIGSDAMYVFRAARSFAERSSLITQHVSEALKELPAERSSMVMLGNSVIVLHPEEREIHALSGHGRVFSAAIDREGPKLLKIGAYSKA